MHYTKSSILNKNVSKLGFGTLQIGGPTIFGGKQIGMGKVDQKQAINSINLAVENGINFFDTADIYGRGLSETILTKALGSRINDVIICTKFGNRELSEHKSSYDFSSHWLESVLNESLKRLRRDYIDIFLFHSPPDDFDWNQYDFTALEKLKDQGKIISYGVSCHSYRGAERLLNFENISALEFIYNIIDRRIESKVLNHQNIKNKTTIARVPLCMGFLSGKYFKQFPNYNSNDFRSNIKKEHSDWIVESVRKLGFLNKLEGGISASAIRFCLSNDKISTIIPGMRNTEQVQRNLEAENLGPLSLTEIERIRYLIPDVHPDW